MSTLDPYPFQRHVADLLLSGQSVILQAPTGAGKTFAAKLPFFEARQQGLDFPRKCIYAVPMRVLANQFAAEKLTLPLQVAIQTGEHRDDPQFTADITFATIDQVLSSFLLAPYSLPRRLANLNAGAIASSYLVFDEFHLFEPTAMLPTTLEMLRMLRGVVPFLLMTATFSRDMLHGLADILWLSAIPWPTPSPSTADCWNILGLATQTCDCYIVNSCQRTVPARSRKFAKSMPERAPSRGIGLQ